MAYYITLTINTDYAPTIPNHPNEFIQKIIRACSGLYYQAGQDGFNLGVDEPFVFLQKPKLYSETSVFIYKQGKLHEINEHAAYTRDLKDSSPEVFTDLVNFLKETVKSVDESQVINSGEISSEKILLTSNEPKLVFQPDGFADVSSEKDSEEAIVAKWLKSNKIPTTVAKLKKLKPNKK